MTASRQKRGSRHGRAVSPSKAVTHVGVVRIRDEGKKCRHVAGWPELPRLAETVMKKSNISSRSRPAQSRTRPGVTPVMARLPQQPVASPNTPFAMTRTEARNTNALAYSRNAQNRCRKSPPLIRRR